MNVWPVLLQYYGKFVRVVDTEGREFEGLFSQYQTFADELDEPEEIDIRIDDHYVAIPVLEVESITVIDE